MLPPSSGLKHGGSEVSLAIWQVTRKVTVEPKEREQRKKSNSRQWAEMNKKCPLQGAHSFIIIGGKQKQKEEERTCPGIHHCFQEESQTDKNGCSSPFQSHNEFSSHEGSPEAAVFSPIKGLGREVF